LKICGGGGGRAARRAHSEVRSGVHTRKHACACARARKHARRASRLAHLRLGLHLRRRRRA
jgi:hypothetical protein